VTATVLRLITSISAFFALSCFAATLYVDVNSSNPIVPYTNWATAAHVIQDAVNAAASNDTVLVTNGLYQTGAVGSPAGTNRVVINKPGRAALFQTVATNLTGVAGTNIYTDSTATNLGSCFYRVGVG
jgi:hypothetical protein